MSPSLTFQDSALVEAILYVGCPSADIELEKVRESAQRLGFEVSFEMVEDDPDGSKLRDALPGAKVGGIGVVIVPTLVGLGAKSMEDFRARLTHLVSEGFEFKVLDPRHFHKTPMDLIAEIDGWHEVNNFGKSRGTKQSIEKRKEAGEHIGRSPKCGKCGHGVHRRGGGKGHLRTADGNIGPCFAESCGCVRYEPRNERMMGRPKS